MMSKNLLILYIYIVLRLLLSCLASVGADSDLVHVNSTTNRYYPNYPVD